MKKTFILIFISIIPLLMVSQQQPQFSHYIFNQFAFNPAVAGSKACLDATLGYRNQWVGFEGAPKTAFGGVHTVFKKNKLGLENKHAFGVYIESDRYGPFSRAKFKLAYAYHFPLNRDILMSMGLFVGIEQLSFRSGEVTLINFNDDAIGQAANAIIVPELTPGIFLQSEKWFGGLSIHQTTTSQLKAVGTSESKLVRHGMLTGGTTFKREKWSFIPSALIKIAPSVPTAVDINIMADYKKTFAFGLTYRNTDAVVALVRFRALDYFTVGYAFDYTLSQIQAGASNSHEIMLSINPCGNKKGTRYACPTFY